MLIKRTATWLFAWGALLWAPMALAQVPANSNLEYQTTNPSYENGSAPFAESEPRSHRPFVPFHPTTVEPQWRWFGPAETSSYGNGPRAKVGWFGSYERLFWSLSAPEVGYVGSLTAPPSILETNSIGPTVDNSFIGAIGAWGNRFEVGFIDADNYGWLASVLDHVNQAQFRAVEDPNIRFNDPNGLLHAFVPITIPGFGTFSEDIGELPTNFSILAMKNVLVLNGLELMRMYRAPRLHNGGYFELLYGTRWLQISDTINIQAVGHGNVQETGTISPFGVGTTFSFSSNILDGSSWSTRVINNLVGPQLGGRWSRQQGRWVTSVEARFLAAANFQNASQKTHLGDQTLINQAALDVNLTTPFRGLGTNTHQYNTTFSPTGELRAQVTCQVSSNVGLKVGYTGLIVGDISRASNRVDYSGPNLISILPTNIHQIFFSNGLNFGVEINR
jgi:hypothetical protein